MVSILNSTVKYYLLQFQLVLRFLSQPVSLFALFVYACTAHRRKMTTIEATNLSRRFGPRCIKEYRDMCSSEYTIVSVRFIKYFGYEIRLE